MAPTGESIDARTGYRRAGGIQHTPGDDTGASAAARSGARDWSCRGEPLHRVHHGLQRIRRGDVNLEVEVIIGGAAGVADPRDPLTGGHSLPHLHVEHAVVGLHQEDGPAQTLDRDGRVVADRDDERIALAAPRMYHRAGAIASTGVPSALLNSTP